MSSKALIFLCASACFVQVVRSQCIKAPFNAAMMGPGISDGIFGVNDIAYGGRFANDLALLEARGLAYDGYGGPANGLVAPTSEGGFIVTCSSPIAPMGLAVTSENVIEGILAVTGDLPVLSAVAIDSALPSTGSGAVVYGCGDGSVGIVSEVAPKPYGQADLPYGNLAGNPYRGSSPISQAPCGYGAI